MTFEQWLDNIEKQNPTQDMLQYAPDQVLMNCIKNIYQPNQKQLIRLLKAYREVLDKISKKRRMKHRFEEDCMCGNIVDEYLSIDPTKE